jgi:diguanylate cyclase (GGDEF)-like protein/PAS domain S-box-containing protein
MDTSVDVIATPTLSSEEMSLLLGVGERLVSELDLEYVLPLVAEAARQVVHAETLAVPVIDPDGQTFTYRAANGKFASMLLNQTYPIHEGTCGWVIHHQRPLLFGEGGDFELDSTKRWRPGMASNLLVPLICRGRIIGGLSAMGKEGGASFSLRDLAILKLFANQASVALDNARLFKNLAASVATLEERVAERTQHLSDALDFNKTILLCSPLPVGVYASSGQCVLANNAFARLFGTSREALEAQNFHDIAVWRESGLRDDCIVALAQHSPQQREINFVTSLDKEIWAETKMFPTHLNGISHLLIQFTDLTERKRMEEELRHIAFHDSMTRLPNRRLLLDRLVQALQTGKRQKSYLAVLFIDLNKFKQLNDTCGHDAGDQMLIEVARRLEDSVRDCDTVARLGGDEFVVLLEGLGTEVEQAEIYADRVADKLRRTLSEEYVLGDIRHWGSASVGIRLFLGDESDPDQIIKEADAAMYEVKRKRDISA